MSSVGRMDSRSSWLRVFPLLGGAESWAAAAAAGLVLAFREVAVEVGVLVLVFEEEVLVETCPAFFLPFRPKNPIVLL